MMHNPIRLGISRGMNDKSDNPLMATAITHYDELSAFVLRKVGSVAAAADIVQETCLRLLNGNRANTDTIRNPRAYLFRAVNNLITERARQDAGRNRYFSTEPPPEDATDHAPDAERLLIDRQRLGLLMEAVEDLPPRCREVFVLRRFEALSQAEIAERLGISRSMVDKHLRHALQFCATRLEERE